MTPRLFALATSSLLIALTARAERENLCARIAALEDEGRLSEYYIAPARDRMEGIHLIDLDGDGTEEEVEIATNGDVYEVEGERLASYPDIRSAYSHSTEILHLDGTYYGVSREIDTLYRVWRFRRDSASGKLNGFNHTCGFDREWTDTGNCSRAERGTARLELERSESSERGGYLKPQFLDEVFGFYNGIIASGEPVELDIDHDGKNELVGTVIMQMPHTGYTVFIETPAIMSDLEDELIEPTFQNARLLQFMARYGYPRQSLSFWPKISLLLPENDSHDILIESRRVREPFDRYAPSKPFRRIFRLRGNWPEQVCESEFEWTTLYTDDPQD